MKKENNLSMYVTKAYHSLQLPKGSMYNNYIREKQTRSFSAPYSTNCTDRNFISNSFSGGYNYDSCRETCAFITMWPYVYTGTQCNGTIDIWKKCRSQVKPRDKCLTEHLQQALRRK